jgi:hypothetical protein
MKTFISVLIVIVAFQSYIGITKSCCSLMSGGKDKACMHDALCSKCVMNQNLQREVSLHFVPVKILISYDDQVQNLFEISEQPSVPPPKA